MAASNVKTLVWVSLAKMGALKIAMISLNGQ